MIPDYVAEIGLLHASLETDDVEETFIALREFRPLLDREQAVELHSDEDGILHLALGIARMHIPALDMNFGRGCIEILEFQLADLSSVHCVGIFSPEFLHVELHHAASDFLVRGESDFDFPVLELRMLHHILDGVHDLSHTCLVVGSEQCRAVGGNDGFPLVGKQFREFGRLEEESRHSLQGNVAAVVILDDLRPHIGPGGIRRGIHMGNETHNRHLPVNVGRQCCHYISVFVERGFHAHCGQLVPEHPEQIQLLC